MEALEKRVKICTDEKRHLEKKVSALEKQNSSLLGQLKKLQKLVTEGTRQTARTGTCAMVRIYIWTHFLSNLMCNLRIDILPILPRSFDFFTYLRVLRWIQYECFISFCCEQTAVMDTSLCVHTKNSCGSHKTMTIRFVYFTVFDVFPCFRFWLCPLHWYCYLIISPSWEQTKHLSKIVKSVDVRLEISYQNQRTL